MGQFLGILLFATLMILTASALWAYFRFRQFFLPPATHTAILESLSDPIFIINAEDRLVYFNQNAAKLYNLRKTHTGKPVADFLPQWPGLKEKTLGGEQIRQQISLTIDNELVLFEVKITPVQNRKGKILVCILVLRPFTEHEKLTDQLHQFATAAAQNPVSMVITDPKGMIEYVNPQFEKLSGYRLDEVYGKSTKIFSSGETPREVYADLWETILSGNNWQGEMLNRRKNGETYWEESIISPVKDNKGNITHFIAMKQDLGPRKKTQAEIVKRLRELDAINTISLAAASQLDLSGLARLVGQKIQEIFSIQSLFIAIYDTQKDVIDMLYWVVEGDPLNIEPIPYGTGLSSIVLKTKASLLIDEDFATRGPAMGANMDGIERYGYPKSWLGIPIISGDEAIGLIGVQDFQREHAFNTDDIQLLTTISANIAIALENARLYISAQNEIEHRKQAEKETRQRAEQLAAYFATSRVILSGIELNSVLTKIHDECQKIANVDIFTIIIPDDAMDKVEIIRLNAGNIASSEMPMPNFNHSHLHAEVLREKQTIYIPDIFASDLAEKYPGFLAENSDMHTYLGVPIQQGENTIGVMAIQQQNRHAFSPEHLLFFETIASLAAIAIRNARLYHESRQRADEMASLYDIGIALSSKLDLNQVLQILFERCRQILPMDSFYVAIYDDRTFMLQHPLFFDSGEYKQVAIRDIRTTPGLSGEVILNKETLYISDALDPTANKHFQIVRLGGRPSRSYVGVPMIVRDRVMGVVSMQSYRPRAYSPEQIRLLETIAHQAAIAIENSQLYQQAQNELDWRKQTQDNLEKTNAGLQVQLSRVEALQNELRDQANRDPLTGLFNRRHLEEHLRRKLAQAQRKGAPLSVIMVDIDHFKQINDQYGHKTGDEFLKLLSNVLIKFTRSTDFPCRYGGEEFLVILGDAPLEIAAKRAEAMRSAFESAAVDFQGLNLKATISLGVSAYPQHGNEAETLIIQADQAMYAAKTQGRNRVIIWHT